MKTLSRLSIVFLLSLVLVSCSKEPVGPYIPSAGSGGAPEGKDIEYAPPQYNEQAGPSMESLDSAGGGNATNADATGSAADQTSDEYKRMHGRSSEQLLPIYFDFDQASIRNDQFTQLDHNADYLKNNPAARVVIEGNCDDRGTNEYNLALGERRALNARTYLIEAGVQESRIRTVSYGEERPLFPGEDEASWSQNRRDDFVLE